MQTGRPCREGKCSESMEARGTPRALDHPPYTTTHPVGLHDVLNKLFPQTHARVGAPRTDGGSHHKEDLRSLGLLRNGGQALCRPGARHHRDTTHCVVLVRGQASGACNLGFTCPSPTTLSSLKYLVAGDSREQCTRTEKVVPGTCSWQEDVSWEQQSCRSHQHCHSAVRTQGGSG